VVVDGHGSLAMMLAANVAALPNYTLPPAKPGRCADKCAARYRHTVLRSTEDPMDTWRSALGNN
jgi:hypothetical protein